MEPTEATSLDELISSASKRADENARKAASPQPLAATQSAGETHLAKDQAVEEKTEKKDKEKSKNTRLVYSDNGVSPEEKMARLSRYAFTPQKATVTA